MQAVAARGLAHLRAELKVVLDLLQRPRVDQVAQLLLPEQLAQQLAVERQRRGPALGVRRVALVHVRRHVVEQQRGGERRRGRGLDLDQRQLATVERGQQLDETGDIEHVAQALAVGLENDRKLSVLLRDLEQRLRLQPLLPQRRPLAGARSRDQQRAGGVLAEARAEQSTRGELGDDGVLDLVGLEHHQINKARPGGSSASGRWTMIPSSDQIASDSSPSWSRIRALSASPHAAWTPPAERTQHA